MAQKFGPYPAKVVAIHDGDTITMDIDLGFDHLIEGLGWDGSPRLSCRIWAINAPELRTQVGKDALVFIKTIVSVGQLVTVMSHGWDKYGGRFDGEVFLADGSSLGDLMVAGGHAVRMSG